MKIAARDYALDEVSLWARWLYAVRVKQPRLTPEEIAAREGRTVDFVKAAIEEADRLLRL